MLFDKKEMKLISDYKKVQKYYNQIGYGERVLPLKDATVEGVYDRISKYVDAPIALSEEIYERARRNDALLDAFLSEVSSGEKNYILLRCSWGRNQNIDTAPAAEWLKNFQFKQY